MLNLKKTKINFLVILLLVLLTIMKLVVQIYGDVEQSRGGSEAIKMLLIVGTFALRRDW